jgi:hypothetical protein
VNDQESEKSALCSKSGSKEEEKKKKSLIMMSGEFARTSLRVNTSTLLLQSLMLRMLNNSDALNFIISYCVHFFFCQNEAFNVKSSKVFHIPYTFDIYS